MTDEAPRVVFGSGFDGLFSKELRAQLTPALETELAALGVRTDKPFQAGYAIETWAATVNLLASRLYPQLAPADSFFRLGQLTVKGFADTFVGKAAFGLMRLLGPARSVERAARSYASTNNYTRVGLKRVAPTAFEFHLNEIHTLPEFDVGVVTEVLHQVGAKSPKVTLLDRDVHGFTMHVTWE